MSIAVGMALNLPLRRVIVINDIALDIIMILVRSTGCPASNAAKGLMIVADIMYGNSKFSLPIFF